jgi:hypothetical protein
MEVGIGTLVQTLRLINIFCAAINAGGMVLVLVVDDPLNRKFPLSLYVPFHRATGRTVHQYMRPITILSGLAAVLILVLDRDLNAGAAALTLAGLVCTLVVILVSQLWLIPMNPIIHAWSAEAPPADHLAVRQRWDGYHALRTAAGSLALVLYIAAALSR